MEIKEFKEIIEAFVSENFRCDGCKFCAEQGIDVIPDDWKPLGSKEESNYDKALIELYKKMGFYSTCFLENLLSDFLNKKITEKGLRQKYQSYCDIRNQ